MARKTSPRKNRALKKKKATFYATFRNRGVFLVCVLVGSFFSMGMKMVQLGLEPTSEPTLSYENMKDELSVRGSIYDANGMLLATTLKVQSLYADPAMMFNPEEAVRKLKKVLPDVNVTKFKERFSNSKSRFVWVKRHLTPEQVKQVNDLGIPGLAFREEETRVYPHKTLAAHIIGAVDPDQKGIAGIENAYNDVLSRGEDITLTVDSRLQTQLHRTLAENMVRTGAKATWGVVLDAETGNVLALSSLPDFDPNHYSKAPQETWANRAFKGVYEMGSVFKIFTMAQALEEGIATLVTPFDCTEDLKVGRFTISDFHPKRAWLSAEEIFIRSSNVGTARIADQFEKGAQKEFFSKLGFLSPVEVGGMETSHPLYSNRWGRIQTMTRSYGHGIAVSAMHVAAAVAAVSTDGMYKTPAIVNTTVREKPRRVVSEETAEKVASLLRKVVQEGTGRRAQLAGYAIGGKTGTAEKPAIGGYSENKNLASFVGVVPTHNPRWVVLVAVDEGKKGANMGGTAAAPAFKDFIRRAAPIVGLRPELAEPNFAENALINEVTYATLTADWSKNLR